MEGDVVSTRHAGIIPRAVKMIFDHFESCGTDFSLLVSHLEIYNEQIRDLLNPSGAEKLVLMRRRNSTAVFCKHLKEVTVNSADERFAVYKRGVGLRQTAKTLCNKRSSRSHTVFMVKIMIKKQEKFVRQGQLNFVDLAGCESVGRSGADGVHALEAGFINKSLLAFNRVVTALAEQMELKHVPFRGSKLTYLLTSSLCGSAKTCIIATVTPLLSDVETLRVVFKAKSIQKSVAVKFSTREHLVAEADMEVWTSPINVSDAQNKRKTVRKSVEDWTQHQVGEWLQKIGLGEFKEVFQHCGFNGSWLLRLDADDLERNKIVFTPNQWRLFSTSLEGLQGTTPRTAVAVLKTPEQFKTSSKNAATVRSDCHVTKRVAHTSSASPTCSDYDEYSEDWLNANSDLFVSFEDDDDEDVGDLIETESAQSGQEEEEEDVDVRSPPHKRIASSASCVQATVERLCTTYGRQSVASELRPPQEGGDVFDTRCEEDEQLAQDSGGTDDGYLSEELEQSDAARDDAGSEEECEFEYEYPTEEQQSEDDSVSEGGCSSDRRGLFEGSDDEQSVADEVFAVHAGGGQAEDNVTDGEDGDEEENEDVDDEPMAPLEPAVNLQGVVAAPVLSIYDIPANHHGLTTNSFMEYDPDNLRHYIMHKDTLVEMFGWYLVKAHPSKTQHPECFVTEWLDKKNRIRLSADVIRAAQLAD